MHDVPSVVKVIGGEIIHGVRWQLEALGFVHNSASNFQVRNRQSSTRYLLSDPPGFHDILLFNQDLHSILLDVFRGIKVLC